MLYFNQIPNMPFTMLLPLHVYRRCVTNVIIFIAFCTCFSIYSLWILLIFIITISLNNYLVSLSVFKIVSHFENILIMWSTMFMMNQILIVGEFHDLHCLTHVVWLHICWFLSTHRRYDRLLSIYKRWLLWCDSVHFSGYVYFIILT